jgi:hypothetical protein
MCNVKSVEAVSLIARYLKADDGQPLGQICVQG